MAGMLQPILALQFVCRGSRFKNLKESNDSGCGMHVRQWFTMALFKKMNARNHHGGHPCLLMAPKFHRGGLKLQMVTLEGRFCVGVIIIGADTSGLNGFTAGVRATLGIIGGRCAYKGALFIATRRRGKSALRRSGHARWHVGRAGCGGAVGRAHLACNTCDLNSNLIRRAAAFWIFVVRQHRRRRGRRGWRRRGCWYTRLVGKSRTLLGDRQDDFCDAMLIVPAVHSHGRTGRDGCCRCP